MRLWLNNILQGHRMAAPVLLAAIILSVYYPVLSGGIHTIDDPGLIARYSAFPSFSGILLPGNGYYYRPIVELTYFLDARLWNLEPSVMHLENLLLHYSNSLLVYLLARKIVCDNPPLIPFFAAMLFALHPVNVEAVAWISGRTDPMCALFVLSSSYFWLRWLDCPGWRDMTAALLLFGAAVLSKETALVFGVVALLLALTWPGSATARQRLTAVGVMAVPGLLLVIFVIFFRNGAGGLSRFMAGADLQLAQSVWRALIALGFYVRKLIVPFPLNFAINSVHSANALIGAVSFPALWWLFRRFRSSGVLFASAGLLLVPAILVALKPVAWTPYAERYLYLSTAFFALGFIGICEVWSKRYSVVLLIFSALLLSGFAFGSFQRNILWGDSQSFFQDAVLKSPEFGSVHHALGLVLMQNGEVDRALEAFTDADRLNQRASVRFPIKSGVMGAKLAKGEFLEARNYFFQLFEKKRDAPADFLELLCTADAKRLDALENEGKVLLAQDLLETLELLNRKKPDPFWLYRSGQISLVAGNNAEAADFFRKAYTAAPLDSHYKAAAKTYYLRLEALK